MYHFLIRRQIRRIFADLNNGEYEATLGIMATHFEHRFSGDSPIGGTWHSSPEFRLWFERLMRVTHGSPGVDLYHVAVAGGPRHATAVAEWTDSAPLADGRPYSNSGVHVIRLRWFKAVSIHAMLDTVVWERACPRMIANGIDEAGAPPIED